MFENICFGYLKISVEIPVGGKVYKNICKLFKNKKYVFE